MLDEFNPRPFGIVELSGGPLLLQVLRLFGAVSPGPFSMYETPLGIWNLFRGCGGGQSSVLSEILYSSDPAVLLRSTHQTCSLDGRGDGEPCVQPAAAWSWVFLLRSLRASHEVDFVDRVDVRPPWKC